ncbi:MAG: ECF transporter S component [Clostridia bacterium]|nr:ECF transporter S component [Clostridia bacterium]
MSKEKSGQARKQINIRMLAGTGMLSAIGVVLMFFDFSIPIVPAFIKMDFSELPALLAGFAYGPLAGVAVCFIKNLIHLAQTSTMGIGELCNFLLGVSLVLPAGWIYKKRKSRKWALIGALIGSVSMAVLSLPINYFVTYPMYIEMFASHGGWDAILGMYQAIFPKVGNLLECLAVFNLPFTLAKGLVVSLLCFLIYKPLSPILHGRIRH